MKRLFNFIAAPFINEKITNLNSRIHELESELQTERSLSNKRRLYLQEIDRALYPTTTEWKHYLGESLPDGIRRLRTNLSHELYKSLIENKYLYETETDMCARSDLWCRTPCGAGVEVYICTLPSGHAGDIHMSKSKDYIMVWAHTNT